MNYIDLHMHTIFSDGTMSCQEILNKTLEADIKMFSITDHEDIRSVYEMKKILNENNYNIKYIPGVEIATSYLNKEFHLTVYGVDENNEALQKLLLKTRSIRLEYGMNIIRYIEENIPCNNMVSLTNFKDYKENPELGGWKALNYLKEIGLVDTLEEYFILLKDFHVKQEFYSPKEVIRIAKDAGGVVFLAHPSSNQKYGLAVKILDEFVEFGIDGIECYSQYCMSNDEVVDYVNYCKKNNLYISGGSDYHGDFIDRRLGNPLVNIEKISHELFLKLSI